MLVLSGETFPGELWYFCRVACESFTSKYWSVRPILSPAQSDLIFLMRRWAAIVWDRRRRTALPPLLPVDCNTGESVVQSTGRKRGRSQVCPTRNYSKTSMTPAHCKHAHCTSCVLQCRQTWLLDKNFMSWLLNWCPPHTHTHTKANQQ